VFSAKENGELSDTKEPKFNRRIIPPSKSIVVPSPLPYHSIAVDLYVASRKKRNNPPAELTMSSDKRPLASRALSIHKYLAPVLVLQKEKREKKYIHAEYHWPAAGGPLRAINAAMNHPEKSN
jgi:hypothetical protein